MSSERKDARDLLAFYLDAGADALVGEEAIDRMADEVSPPPAGGRPDSEAVRVGASNQRTVSGHGPTPIAGACHRAAQSADPLGDPALPLQGRVKRLPRPTPP